MGKTVCIHSKGEAWFFLKSLWKVAIFTVQHNVLLLDLQHPFFPSLPSRPLFKFPVWDIPCSFSIFFVVFTLLLGIYSVFWALYIFSAPSHLSLEHHIFPTYFPKPTCKPKDTDIIWGCEQAMKSNLCSDFHGFCWSCSITWFFLLCQFSLSCRDYNCLDSVFSLSESIHVVHGYNGVGLLLFV